MLNSLAIKQKALNNYIYKTKKVEPSEVYEDQKIALLVELGELANELKFFKYWKEEKEPNMSIPCTACTGSGQLGYDDCIFCKGTGKNYSHNPALEEYVDVLHFMLTLTIYKYADDEALEHFFTTLQPLTYPTLTEQFSALYYEMARNTFTGLDLAWRYFLGLAVMLGFDMDDIENAYHKKNKENYARQDRGY